MELPNDAELVSLGGGGGGGGGHTNIIHETNHQTLCNYSSYLIVNTVSDEISSTLVSKQLHHQAPISIIVLSNAGNNPMTNSAL